MFRPEIKFIADNLDKFKTEEKEEESIIYCKNLKNHLSIIINKEVGNFQLWTLFPNGLLADIIQLSWLEKKCLEKAIRKRFFWGWSMRKVRRNEKKLQYQKETELLEKVKF